MKTVKDYYLNRFNRKEIERKNKIWKILCQCYFDKLISDSNTVMDIGAGYCEFINNIKCAKKIAIDINPETKKYAQKKVKVYNYNATLIQKNFLNKVDIVFVSNFFEHLNSKEEIIKYMEVAHSILKPKGKIIIMQPNIKLAKEKYWDFIDHKQPLTIASLIEALQISNFSIEKAIEKFLPFTTKNSFPIYLWIVNLYLNLPHFLRIGAGQSLIIAKKIHEKK